MICLKKIPFYLMLLFTSMLCIKTSVLNATEELNQHEYFIYTIPKSGTNLIIKYFHMMLKMGILPKKIWHTTHYNEYNFEQNKQYILSHPENKIISLIRDPRDIICSQLDFLERGNHYHHIYPVFTEHWCNLTKNEKINLLIDVSIPKEVYEKYIHWNSNGLKISEKIRESMLRAIQFQNLPQVLELRYEDIVGPKGKGSYEMQIKIFKSINRYLLIDMTNEQFSFLVNSLWGGNTVLNYKSETFFKGYIGRWKEEFDQKNKEIMKKFYGDILIKLGYENDSNW